MTDAQPNARNAARTGSGRVRLWTQRAAAVACVATGVTVLTLMLFAGMSGWRTGQRFAEAPSLTLERAPPPTDAQALAR